jgi:4-amino-4-deoxy-L-arabinose transferase-like glycosyltransferase
MTRDLKHVATPFGSFLFPTFCFGALLALNSWSGSLYNSDEVIYTQMARESLIAGRYMSFSWLDVVIFEKPPLLFWLLQCCGGLLGWTELAMRLPGVIASAIALGYVALLARRVCPERPTLGAWFAPLLCVVTVGFTLNARRPITDPLLTAAMVAMVYYACRVVVDEVDKAAWKLGLAVGLGVLAKWVAIAPAAFAVGIWLLIRRRWHAIRVAAFVFLVVAAPWHLFMTFEYGVAFWETYAGYHVLARATESLHGVVDTTYYLDTLLSQEGLLGVFLLFSVPLSILRFIRRHVFIII